MECGYQQGKAVDGRWVDERGKQGRRRLEKTEESGEAAQSTSKKKFEQSVKQSLQEAGITEQSRAVCKYRRGKAFRQAEAAKRGYSFDRRTLHPSWDYSKEAGSKLYLEDSRQTLGSFGKG